MVLLAIRQRRVIMTLDKDFGEIATRTRSPGIPGVILIGLPIQPPAVMAARLAEIVDARSDWSGNFSVIEPGRVRMRPLIFPEQA